MNYLHTMVRISNIEESLDFFCKGLGLVEVRRRESERGRFTLIFLATPADIAQNETPPMLELTYNWDPETYQSGRNFGHLAFSVDNIYATCEHLEKMNVTVCRPPRDGYMAFVKSPDGISVELLQKGKALEPKEPWASRPNTGSW